MFPVQRGGWPAAGPVVQAGCLLLCGGEKSSPSPVSPDSPVPRKIGANFPKYNLVATDQWVSTLQPGCCPPTDGVLATLGQKATFEAKLLHNYHSKQLASHVIIVNDKKLSAEPRAFQHSYLSAEPDAFQHWCFSALITVSRTSCFSALVLFSDHNCQQNLMLFSTGAFQHS